MAKLSDLVNQARQLFDAAKASEALKILEAADCASDQTGNALRLALESALAANAAPQSAAWFRDLVRHPSSAAHRNFLRRVCPEVLAINESAAPLSVAVLGNVTLEPFADELILEAAAENLRPVFHVGGFDQFQNEILNDAGAFYQQADDAVILLLDYRPLAPSLYNYNLAVGDADVRQDIARLADELSALASRVAEKKKCNVLMTLPVCPTAAVGGFLEGRACAGQSGLMAQLRAMLCERFAGQNGCFLLDSELEFSAIGKNNAFDPVMDYLAHQPYSIAGLVALARKSASFCRQTRGKARKCLVLDLDNTLWGGIIGEDGMEGIQLGPDKIGRAFVDFQRQILRLHMQGVILAVCSKNNQADAEEVFANHPHMILKPEHFASMCINWVDKPTNIRQLARDINIGLDSMVFLDDNPVERASVRLMIPEVLVPELPKDPARYPAFLAGLDVFQTLQITEDDLNRGRSYAQDRGRKDLQRTVGNIQEYYESLQMSVKITPVSEAEIPRMAQLLQRTNQFNLTTRRHTENELRDNLASGRWRAFALRSMDRFGDNGLVGAAILEISAGFCRVDSLLMSCRVLGRNIEVAFLAWLVSYARANGATKFIGEFIPTKKNMQVENFYAANGFASLAPQDALRLWELPVGQAGPQIPSYIRVES